MSGLDSDENHEIVVVNLNDGPSTNQRPIARKLQPEQRLLTTSHPLCQVVLLVVISAIVDSSLSNHFDHCVSCRLLSRLTRYILPPFCALPLQSSTRPLLPPARLLTCLSLCAPSSTTCAMKIVYIGLYRVESSSTARRLACASHLVDFGYFTRSTIAELIQTAARTVVQRTQPGCRQSIELDDRLPFLAHTYVRSDGLAGVVMADKEYPVRVAFTLVTKEMAAYEERVGVNWKKMDHDQPVDEPDFLKEDILHYQASTKHTLTLAPCGTNPQRPFD